MAQTKEGAMKTLAKKIGISLEDLLRHKQQGSKWCMSCRDWHPISEFGKDRTRYDGLVPSCKEFRNLRGRDFYEPIPPLLRRPHGPPKYAPRDGDKSQARHMTGLNLRMGRIVSASKGACSDCGHIGPDRKHEYDHFMGYDAEHHATIQVVCFNCHRRREQKRGKYKRQWILSDEQILYIQGPERNVFCKILATKYGVSEETVRRAKHKDMNGANN